LAEDEEIRSTRDPAELMRAIVERGEVLTRRRTRKRVAQRVAPALLVVVAIAGVVASRVGDGASERQVETVPRPERPAVVDVGPAPGTEVGETGTGPGELPPVPVASPTTTQVASFPSVGGATTATTSAAPPRKVVVALDQREGTLSHTAILRPDGSAVISLTSPTMRASDPPPDVSRQYPVVSPDGRSVVYHGGQENVIGLGGIRTVFELYSVPVTGGPSRRLTNSALGAGGGLMWPDVSPDGSLLVATCPPVRAGSSGLCTMRLDGTDEQTILDTTHHLFFPRWSPDGRSVALMESAADGRVSLWVLAVGQGEAGLRRVPLPPMIRLEDGPMWSADGTQLLLGTPAHLGGASGTLVSVDIASGHVTPHPAVPPSTHFVGCGHDRVILIAMSAFGPASAGDLVAIDLDGGRPQVLLRGAAAQRLAPSSCVEVR
jgi:hypothetical protein